MCPLKLDFIRILLFDDFRHLVLRTFLIGYLRLRFEFLIREYSFDKICRIHFCFMVSSIFQGLTLIKIVFLIYY